MGIKKIRLTNFKSFKELDIDLGNFNIFIGANASGKSNFIKIFEFLKDIAQSGLNNAISMQGGIEYLRNINIGSVNELSIKITFDSMKFPALLPALLEEPESKELTKIETVYEFALKMADRDFEVINDRLSQLWELTGSDKENQKTEKKYKTEELHFSIYQDKGKIKHSPEDIKTKFPMSYFKDIEVPSKSLIVELPFFSMSLLKPKHILGDIGVYNFDPVLPKEAIPITGKAELEKNAGNLSIVLKNLLSSKEKGRKFINLLKDILPFITGLKFKEPTDKYLLLSLQETYSGNYELPASLISDGTINIIALITALYFEEKGLTIIEEPERNIHPHLMSRAVNMMKDASEKKQIIVTTHNPEIIKHADLKDIFLVSRDKDGFSKITKPSEKEEIKIFLENDLGIEELYIQNLLEQL